MEALMTKVSSESDLLTQKHPVEVPAEDDRCLEDDRSVSHPEPDQQGVEAVVPPEALMQHAPRMLAELDSLLPDAASYHQEHVASLTVKLKCHLDSTLQSKEQTILAATQVLHGEESEDDQEHMAWRRAAL